MTNYELNFLIYKVNDANKNESYRNVQEITYWLNQYKILLGEALMLLGVEQHNNER